jgi:hypothetical protein
VVEGRNRLLGSVLARDGILERTALTVFRVAPSTWKKDARLLLLALHVACSVSARLME